MSIIIFQSTQRSRSMVEDSSLHSSTIYSRVIFKFSCSYFVRKAISLQQVVIPITAVL